MKERELKDEKMKTEKAKKALTKGTICLTTGRASHGNAAPIIARQCRS